MEVKEIRNKLVDKGLKVTPQRIAILEAITSLNNHPTAEQVIDYVRQHHPNLATGTAYKILEVMAGRDLIRKVKTDRDIMRYEAMMENHHHLYCIQSDRIEDYMDDELNNMLESYFHRKNIPGFKIEDIKLQIIGRFSDRI